MRELERVQRLGDQTLIEELTCSAKHDRQLTVRMLAELGEVHSRALFRELGFSTMFDYATRQARDLRRHRYPAGDLEPLFERALELLIADEQRRRFAQTAKPRTPPKAAAPKPHSRCIPNAVRRQVWVRDGGRCCFREPDHERCHAHSPLEFHHVVPFARGGAHTADNIVLLCRAHNALQAERDYGREFMQRKSQP